MMLPYNGGWYGMAWMGLAMLVFWGGLLVLGALVLRWLFRSGSAAPRRESAEEILKLRLAKGEISKEQYEEALRLVRS